MKLTEIVPFPKINFPIRLGDQIPWTLTPKEGWGELKNKTVTGSINVMDRIFYKNETVNSYCWILVAEGNSSEGKFYSAYYFNEKDGFVYFYYDFNKYKIQLIPYFIK